MWFYQDKEFTSEMIGNYVGFVYLIENLTNGKKYIGKKVFQFKKKRQVNKKKRRYLAESDWKDYYGSSDTLSADVEALGKDNFRRTILHLCATKKVMTYREVEEQIKRRVLEEPGYYNTNILGRFFVKDVTKQISWRENIVEYGAISKGVRKTKKTFSPRVRSAEHNKKISESNKGKKCPWNATHHTGNQYGVGRKGNGQVGTCWLNNGIANKRCPKDQVDQWLQQGYVFGKISV